ncbi:MAG TPA: TonB-dependent receptor, partial [Bacteroidales bacterium]|nr:TonB-dependent receptor [Bacteroidales bacterium]
DASSRFGPNQKWGNFPSVGFAWKVNKESFFYNNELLKNNVSLFKIRGGWGKIGNENIGNYRYVASVNSNDSRSGYNFGGTAVPGATPISVPNADVHWEEATSTNIGAEINLWKNKLMFTADYYVKNNVDNLIYITVPGVVGIDGSGNNPVSNEGKVRNQGVEFSTTYRSSYKGDSSKYELTYNAGFNFTYNINEVTYQETPRQGGRVDRVGFTANTLTGYPIAGFWGYKVDGIYQNWEEVNAGAQPSAKPGDYKIVDVNGDGQITTDDITYLGSPHPDFTYGLNANLGYAGFDLGISFQGVYGNKIYNATKWYLDGGYLGSNYSTRRLDVWAPDNTDSDQPTDPNWFTGKEQRAVSSAFIEDGSYLRLKNITLGYTLPTKYAEKIKLSNVRVYGQVQNALTFTKYSGFDPEIGTNTELNYEGPEFGVDRGVYPQARSVVFGVNLQF